ISPGSFIKNVAGPKTRRLFLSHQSLRVSTLLCSQVPVSRTRVGVSDRRARSMTFRWIAPTRFRIDRLPLLNRGLLSIIGPNSATASLDNQQTSWPSTDRFFTMLVRDVSRQVHTASHS